MLFNFDNKGPHGRDLVCHIADITVAPDLRSQGIGTALMQKATEVLHEEQATRVEGTVWRGNDASHKLFQDAEFVPESTSYARRLSAPMPVKAGDDRRPASGQSSSFWLIILAIIVAVLAWAEWGPG
ncbi:MAG: GNAT family N-acetyltransferase, partial [Paracoccaceae bacterium]